MTFISITRLRIRSLRFLPLFALHTQRSIRQASRAQGFLGGRLLADRRWTFWTMTSWDSEASMRSFMMSGDHRATMPRLLNWCDEASVVHWTQEEATLPAWDDADRRMRSGGRVSKVRHPSAQHEGLQYAAPRLNRGGEIHPAKVPQGR